MRILVAGMHSVPNQFTRGVHSLGCQWVHWHGGNKREDIPTNCDAVVIAKCQLSHHSFWEAKQTYLDLNRPIFVSDRGFSEIGESIMSWLKSVGHLNDLGQVIKATAERKPVSTIMSQAFTQAEKLIEPPKPKEVVMTHHKQIESFNARKTAETITQLRNADMSWEKIAVQLNKLGMPTVTGKEWSVSTVYSYCQTHQIAGATKRDDAANEPSAKAATPARKYGKQQMTDQELEELMTSNLATGLKLKVIRIVAGVE